MKYFQCKYIVLPSFKMWVAFLFLISSLNLFATQNGIRNNEDPQNNEVECEVNVLEVTGDRNFCVGESTELTATNYQSYLWNTGATTPTVTISEPGTYIVKGIAGSGCVSRDTVIVTQLPSPTANITGNLAICHGSTTVLTTTPSWQVLWSTGSTTDTIVVSTPGNYSVTLTNSYGCTASDEVTVTALPLPITFIYGNTNICDGEGTTLSIADPTLSCVWNNMQTGPSITVSPTDTTTYFCDVTNAYGCTSRIEKTVNVSPLPDVEIIAPEHICADSVVVITATGGDSYEWDSGETTPQISITEGGYHTVVVTLNQCQTSEYVFIEEVANPVITIDGETSFCEGDSVALIASQGVATYLWNIGETTPTITIYDGGTYQVKGTNSYGCSAQASITVTELATPVIAIQGVEQICQGDTTLLSLQEGYTYLWNTLETTSSIVIYPNITTEYSVEATAANGCTATANKQVVVWNSYYETYEDEICIDEDYDNYNFDLPTQTESGTFYHTQNLTTINGCDSIIELYLIVKPKPIFNNTIQGPTVVSDTGVYTYTISNVEHVSRYEWQCSNPFWTFTNSSFTESMQLKISRPGVGTISVYAFNGCGYNSISKDINANVNIVENNLLANIAIYPNPVENQLNLQIDDNTQIDHYVIYDINGKVILKGKMEETKPIFINELIHGQYILQLFDQQKSLGTLKFIKK